MEECTIKVSVLVCTYNHEKFIEEAVCSVLEQEATFTYEVVIIDDCSTDRTRSLAVKLRDQHPQRIRLLLAEKNKNDNRVWMEVIHTTLSPYIALLDGDDYWTSPHKLQRQVNFLDTHPDFSVSFHNATAFFEDGSAPSYSFNHPLQGEIVTLEDLWVGNIIAGCSPMLRRSAIRRIPEWFVDIKWGDWALYILAAEQGNIGYIRDIMGAYRVHNGGVWSGLSESQQIEGVIEFYEQMNVNLNFKYDHIIKPLIAKNYQDLTRVKNKGGDTVNVDVCGQKIDN